MNKSGIIKLTQESPSTPTSFDSCVQFWSSPCQKATKELEVTQSRATQMINYSTASVWRTTMAELEKGQSGRETTKEENNYRPFSKILSSGEKSWCLSVQSVKQGQGHRGRARFMAGHTARLRCFWHISTLQAHHFFAISFSLSSLFLPVALRAFDFVFYISTSSFYFSPFQL